MSEESVRAIPSPVAPARPRSRTNVVPIRGEGDGTSRQGVSTLARRLSSPLVRLLDQASLSVALFLALFGYAVRHGQDVATFLRVRINAHNLVIEIAFLMAWRFVFWMLGMYQPRLNRRARVFLWKVPVALLLCTAVVFPVIYFSHLRPELWHATNDFFLMATGLMLAGRAAIYTYEEHVRPAFRTPRTVIVCGTGARARTLALQLPSNRDFRYQLAGFIDSDPQPDCARLGPLLGSVADLEQVLMRQPIDEVLVALPVKSRFDEIETIVSVCGLAGIQTQYSLDLFTSDVAKHHHIAGDDSKSMVVEMVHQDHRLLLKSAIDCVIAAVGIVALSPVFLAIALAVKLTSKGPVFFVQQRYGLGKRRFGMIKFRSMVVDAEARQAALEHLNEAQGPIFKIKQDPRITAVGRFIRRTSLDELPQLFNVLKGEMSLVGPRPLPNRDVDRFSEAWLMRRFSVKPGITGLWQVSGRSDSDFDAAIRLDLRYIDRWSLLLDLKIIFRTFGAVIKSRGAY